MPDLNVAVSAAHEGQAPSGPHMIGNQLLNIDAGAQELALCLLNFNDARGFGGSINARTACARATSYAIASLAIPKTDRVYWNSGAYAYGGTWVDGADYRDGLKVSTSAGATATFAFTGDTLVIASVAATFCPTSVTITIDGGLPITLGTRNLVTYFGGETSAPTAFVIPGLGPGAHTAVITVPTTDAFCLLWTYAFTGTTANLVLVAGPQDIPADAWGANAPYDQSTPLIQAAWRVQIATLVAGWASCGVNVQYVDPPAGLTDADFLPDHVHYNTSGHAKWAAAFLAAIA